MAGAPLEGDDYVPTNRNGLEYHMKNGNLVSYVHRLYKTGAPFLIFDDRIYVPTNSNDTGVKLHHEGLEFNLKPHMSVQRQEQIDFSMDQSLFKRIRDETISEVINTQYDKAMANQTEYKKRLARFATMDVMPLMIDNAIEASMLLKVDYDGAKTGEEIIKDFIGDKRKGLDTDKTEADEENFNQLRKGIVEQLEGYHQPPFIGDRVEGAENDPTVSLTNLLISNNNILFFGDYGCRLNEINPNRNYKENYLQFGDKFYSPRAIFTVRDFDEGFVNLIKRREGLAALDDYTEEIKNKAKDINNDVYEALAAEGKFNYGNLGWIMKGEYLYLYWEVPKFVLRNPVRPKAYHPFSPTKIAVPISMSGDAAYTKDACVVDAMTYPFLSSWRSDFEKICNLSGQGRDGTPENIIRSLSDSINAFLNGLTIESLERHGRVDEGSMYFSKPLRDSLLVNGEMTRREAMDQGYMITNDWHLAKFNDDEDKALIEEAKMAINGGQK